MPALFLGHGSPLNAIVESEFSRAWEALGRELPRPAAVLCLSAHWETDGWCVTAQERPLTIHDFRGFPAELHTTQYPAPGSAALAARVCELLAELDARPTEDWGLDHGAWSLLRRIYPQADVPVVQLSLDRRATLPDFLELGRRLRPLRREGVLVLGSGNIVHHLGRLDWGDEAGARPAPWAVEFDEWVKARVLACDDAALARAEDHPLWPLAAPSREHFLPLLPILGLREEGEAATFLCERIVMGTLSMRGLRLG
jgi:4,5-DOPA dioxygenase extradiol